MNVYPTGLPWAAGAVPPAAMPAAPVGRLAAADRAPGSGAASRILVVPVGAQAFRVAVDRSA